METVDTIFANRWTWIQNPVEILESVWDYEVKNYIGKTEINNSKYLVINTFFKSTMPQHEPVYYTYADACEFVSFAAEELLKWLTAKCHHV